MYAQLYTPLPDLNLYLDRIQITKPAKADLKNLNDLIYAHQCHIPFENLDIFEFHKFIDLGIEKLFEKVILRNRGGYCFELNTLFSAFLREYGFKVQLCTCRILRGKDFIPPSLHCGILVTLKEKLWFCDVGYGGPMPGGALLVEDGFEKTYWGQTFRIDRADSYWWTVHYVSGQEQEKILQFTTMPQKPVEFLAPNEYCSRNENSVFLNERLVNMRTKNGSLSIVNDTFYETVDHVRTEKKIPSPEKLDQLLKSRFGIIL